MAKKQLRTVKKSGQTGSLNRAEVRSAVITARDHSSGQSKTPGSSKASRNAPCCGSKGQHSGGGSGAAATSEK